MLMWTPMPKSEKKPQSQNFIRKARELGCGEDEAAFEDRLRRIVPRPKKEVPKKKRVRSEGRK